MNHRRKHRCNNNVVTWRSSGGVQLHRWRSAAVTIWFGLPVRIAAASNLKDLKRGDCKCGSISEPGQIARLQIEDADDWALPGKIRCPVVLEGLGRLPEWKKLAPFAEISRWERQAPTPLHFDASASGEFSYWDNNSLLAEHVRSAGVIEQGYKKMLAPPEQFFNVFRGVRARARTCKTEQAQMMAVRYGAKMSFLVPKEVAAKVEKVVKELGFFSDSPTQPLLAWLSSAGSYSTAHYDNFHSAFVMLAGEKEFLLSPPSDLGYFHTYPGTHPMARQARRQFGTAQCSSSQQTNASVEVDSVDGAHVCTTVLKGKEALFLPAGWIHHVHAQSASIALALTTLPWEFTSFNKWITDADEALPFLKSMEADWNTGLLTAALVHFVPALLQNLAFKLGTGDPLDILFNRSYSEQTLSELGMADADVKVPACRALPRSLRHGVALAAKTVSDRFKGYSEDLLLLYLLPYLETILSKVAGPEQNPAAIMTIATKFAHRCLRTQGAA